MTQTKNTMMPIINGSFNHEITNDDMLAFDFDTKKQMAWNLIVSMEFAHSFRDVDPKVFLPIPSKYTYDMLIPKTIDDVLVNLRTEYQQRHKQLLTLTSNYYYKQGQDIAKAQKEFGFGGFLQMDYRKMIGYVQAGGSWNKFNHNKVADGIKELDQKAPRFYMPNNVNNGSKRHVWTTSGEYITMRFDYISKKDREAYMNFYKDHFQIVAQRIHADSIRYELTEIPNGDGACSIEFIMWWD